MIIGVPRETTPDEYRVAMLPAGAMALRKAGHQVLVETQAGSGSGFSDEDYAEAAATIVGSAKEVFARAELILKVKDPQPAEIAMLRPGQIAFAYFHFAVDRELTLGMLKSNSIAIAYETVTDKKGTRPLLTPMSEVAGKMSVQEGAKYLERPMLGRGILLGGVPGVEPAHVLIIGGGVVGMNAAKVAAGLGARVVIVDVNIDRLRYLSDVMPANVQTLFSDPVNIRQQLALADLVIGAVLIPGARCPVLVPREYLSVMKHGAVVVDVGVDQGGCFETIRPTTHADPTYLVDGILHYGVANMPGAVGRTSTFALTNATLPYVLRIAAKGWKAACKEDPGLAAGVNIAEGKTTNKPVAEHFNLPYTPLAP